MKFSTVRIFGPFARGRSQKLVTEQLDAVLAADSQARSDHPQAIQQLQQVMADLGERQVRLLGIDNPSPEAIEKAGREQVIHTVAYRWFNRFCALRYLDVHGYNSEDFWVVSTALGGVRPVIYESVLERKFDSQLTPAHKQKVILQMLKEGDGISDKLAKWNDFSREEQLERLEEFKKLDREHRALLRESYRMLVLAACNRWHQVMPNLFQPEGDYTELLMPTGLMQSNSILAYTREAMTRAACPNLEIISKLYEYYFAGASDDARKRAPGEPFKVESVTASHVPLWISRYMVENSLGRLWMLNNPGSSLAQQMRYYIPPQQPDKDFLQIERPEDIKIFDPACGSGDILAYAFDLLYSIYSEAGCDPADIPQKILKHNLYGMDIDKRSCQIAEFVLNLKAFEKLDSVPEKPLQINICTLDSCPGDFEYADVYGSLIRPEKQELLSEDSPKSQVQYLSDNQYHVVITNPPYVGYKGMDQIHPTLLAWSEKHYPDSKFNTYAMFILRALELTQPKGYSAIVALDDWMFHEMFKDFRHNILSTTKIESLAHLERISPSLGLHGSISVWQKAGNLDAPGAYCEISESQVGEEGQTDDGEKDGEVDVFPPQVGRGTEPFTNGGLYWNTTRRFSELLDGKVEYWHE